jgi:hypothetical protein
MRVTDHDIRELKRCVDAAFSESDHPRDNEGKFGSGSGGSKSKVGYRGELNRPGIPGFWKGQKVTVQERVVVKGGKGPKDFTGKREKYPDQVRIRVTNEEGKSAWLDDGDLD